MDTIITDAEKLKAAAPLKFLDDSGAHKEEGQGIIDRIKAIMESDKNVLALSAPQIGIDKRVFCIRFNDVIKSFINPVITKKADYKIAPEKCVSMPGKEVLITRPEDVTVVYYNDEFKYEDNKLIGPAARIFDQQAQMLDGILPSELGLVADIEENGSFSDLSDDEMKQAIEIYKQFIAVKSKAASEAITDENDKKAYNQLKFAEDVINNRIQVVEDKMPHDKMNREQRRAYAKNSRKAKK